MINGLVPENANLDAINDFQEPRFVIKVSHADPVRWTIPANDTM